jgi:transcription antitermination factor NusG
MSPRGEVERVSKGGTVSDRQTEACSTENALHARWAFDVTPGRERHVALQLQELGCTDVERPTKGYVIAHCDPTAVPVIKRLSGVVRALPLLDTDLFENLSNVEPLLAKVADVVQVSSGPYAQMTGILRALDGEDVLVDVSLMGRVVRVRAKATHVSVMPLPEPWR